MIASPSIAFNDFSGSSNDVTARQSKGRSVLGSKSKISGSNLFSRLNFWVVTAGGNIMTTPPALTGVAAPPSATVALSASAMTFALDSIPESMTNLKLVILASDPQSNDVKNGTPTAGNPKVSYCYFYINTATGEKSADMYVAAKLSA